MPIQWRDALSVGDPQIDQDHKHLINLVNEFEAAMAGQVDHRKVARILLGLFNYTQEHFTREEKLQLDIRYPFHDGHRHAHRDLVRSLADILERYSLEKEEERRDAMVREMIAFLRQWLVDHIIENDLRMRPYIKKWQEQLRHRSRPVDVSAKDVGRHQS